MKYIIGTFVVASMLLLNSCSPKSSQPCPRVVDHNLHTPVQTTLISADIKKA